MSEPSCDEIEYEILTLVASRPASEPLSTDLPQLRQTLVRNLGDLQFDDLVEGLKRLHNRQLVALEKFIAEPPRFEPYHPLNTDAQFFYRGSFRVRRTPTTKQRREELLEQVAAEPVWPQSSISARSQRARFRKWERIGAGIIELDLSNGGAQHVGGTPEVRELAKWWLSTQNELGDNKATPPALPVASTTNSKAPKYEVALSFAGEDRPYVQKVADELCRQKVAVFYDQYEEVTLWGKNLYVHLQNIYQREARFTVMFVSAAYAKKLWTNHERESAQARAFAEHSEYILPARFDDTQIPGLLPTVAHVDLRKKTPIELAALIFKKIRS